MTDTPKPNVILLFGDDALAMQERLDDFIGRLTEAGNAEINLARFSASRLDAEALETQLLAAPFLAPRRMVVLDLGTLTARRLDFPERFFRLLETMPATSVVVALERVDYQALERHTRGASSGDPAQAHAVASPFYRWVRENPGRAVARELRTPRGAAFERWAIQRARQHGAEMDGKAAALLRQYTGEETLAANQELRKLADYVDGARPIGAADLERLTPFHAEADVFAMVDAVGGQDGPKAMRTMQTLLAEEDPRYVFTMVVRQFRLLLLARDALDRGLPPRQVLTESPHRLPGFVADKVSRQALGFTLAQLSDIYRELLALDVASKSGRAELTLGLESLVAALAG